METRLVLGLSVLLLSGCPGSHDVDAGGLDSGGLDSGRLDGGGLDSGFDAAAADAGECFFGPPIDTDGDSIADRYERDEDFDGDGTPNFQDLDSDGDGASDADERGVVGMICDRPRDCDSDDFPDFLDLDSDGDGLPDERELAAGTDLCGADTDGDGCDDLEEVGFDACEPRVTRYASPCYRRFEVRVTVSTATPTGPVRLVLESTPGFTPVGPSDFEVTRAVEATGPGAGSYGTPSGTSFTEVQPSAELVFELDRFSDRTQAASVMTLRLVDDSGAEVGVTVVVIDSMTPCPILI